MRNLSACVVGLLVLGCGVFLPGCAQSKVADSSDSDLPAVRDGSVTPEFAYAVGLAFGRRLRERLDEQKLTADGALVERGLRDGMRGETPRYPEDQMEQAIAQIELAVHQRWAEQQLAADPTFRKVAEENLKNSREALVRMGQMEGVEALPGGLLRKVVKSGNGRFVANARMITVNYEVDLADGTLISASDAGTPTKAYVARLPKAIAEAIAEMRVGDIWRLAVPPEKAYGLAGRPPIIGANQALMIQIELLGAE